MKKNHFAFPYEHIDYRYASHFLIPTQKPESPPFKAFSMERRYPKECAESRYDSLNKTIEWLKKW